jgi:hypothetical protein
MAGEFVASGLDGLSFHGAHGAGIFLIKSGSTMFSFGECSRAYTTLLAQDCSCMGLHELRNDFAIFSRLLFEDELD